MRTLALLFLPAVLAAAQPDPLLDRIAARVAGWRANLPDFYCTQDSRSQHLGSGRGWHLSDTVSYELRVVSGRESYFLKDVAGITIETPTAVDYADMVNRGEFSSALLVLFDTPTQTRFRRAGREKVEGRKLRRYDFTVRQENSRWYVGPGKGYPPAYRGSLWAEESTGKIYRLDMEARAFPKNYPIRYAGMSITYDEVTIHGDEFLMPAQAHVRACGDRRGCNDTVSLFSHYRHFTADSRLVAGQEPPR